MVDATRYLVDIDPTPLPPTERRTIVQRPPPPAKPKPPPEPNMAGPGLAASEPARYRDLQHSIYSATSVADGWKPPPKRPPPLTKKSWLSAYLRGIADGIAVMRDEGKFI
jgi:hypothetical protein